MNRVEITRCVLGLCYMQVCAEADVTDEEILSICNSKNPSGTTGGWQKVVRNSDKPEYKNKIPVKCDKYSDRKHFIVVC